MDITYAKYIANEDGENKMVKAIISGKTWDIPIHPDNSDYAEIMRQVEAGELVIQEADAE